jgi:large subunit ribosomal protein L49
MATPRHIIALPRRVLTPLLSRRLSTLSNQQQASTREAPASPTPQTSTLPPASSESYFVRRTAPGNLPVYQTQKRGGNLRETRVKKVEGDVAALRDQLREALGVVDEGDVSVSPLTRDVVVRVSVIFVSLRGFVGREWE